MYLLLSSRARGSLQVLRVRSGEKGLAVKLKDEFGLGPHHHAQEIRSFSILNQHYFVVARSGILQLYERQCPGPAALAYKLVKEWKNSVTGPTDQVVAVGTFRNQYMYTCSRDGKFVIRDLINDDADDSFKAYSIEKPVHCVHVKACDDSSRVLVVAGSSFTQVKFYDLDFSSPVSARAEHYCHVDSRFTPSFRMSDIFAHRMTVRRTATTFFHCYDETARLAPLLSASTISEHDRTYSESEYSAVAKNMVSSILLVTRDYTNHICVGTQLGDLLVFVTNGPYHGASPYKSISLSHFPINTLASLNDDRYIVYTDTMSKVGVVDTRSWQVVNFYDFLRIGPTVSAKIYTGSGYCKGKFKPVYVMASTVDGTVVIYRLHDDNSYELKLTVSGAGVVPSFDMMDSDAYSVLEATFEKPSGGIKRRKTEKLAPMVPELLAEG